MNTPRPPATHLPAPPESSAESAAGAENYQIGREVATGGMGSIMEAEDSKLRRTVAIKVMLLDAGADESLRQRFVREAEVLALLAHPNIVPIYDLVWEDGLPLFYTMKLVKGRTLQAILGDLRKEDAEALREYTLERLLLIFRKVCDAVAFAHSKGVLHRDLKPENVMVGEFGEVLVMDWGLARLQDRERGSMGEGESASGSVSPAPARSSSSSSFQTMHGAVLGTPQYMSPEQAQGRLDEIDERTDIYALGGILYTLLTLRPPVDARTPQEALEKVSNGEITPPSAFATRTRRRGLPVEKGEVLDAPRIKPLPHTPGGRVPAALSSVAMKALHRDRARRYPSVTALSADLEAYQSGFATSAEEAGAGTQLRLLLRRHKVLTASLAALLLISVGFVWKVMASERRATRGAEVAAVNERLAKASAAEAERSLARAQLALADEARKRADGANMSAALEVVPSAERGQLWNYLDAQRDSSLGPLEIPGFCEQVEDVWPVPGQPAQFAIASGDGRVGFVDVVSRKLRRTLATGEPGPLRLAFSGDGRRLLCRISTQARVYETATGREIQSFPQESLAEIPVELQRASALDQMGMLAALADTERGEIRLVDATTGEVRWTTPARPLQMIFHPDGKRLFVIEQSSYVLKIFRVADGMMAGNPRLFAHPLSIALSPDGRVLAIGLLSGDVTLLETFGGAKMERHRIMAKSVAQVAWSAGGNLLALDGSATNSLVVARTLHLWRQRDYIVRVGQFMGIKAYRADLPLRVNLASGHLLTTQSPPQLWHFPDHALASLNLGPIGWSGQFLSDTVLLARAESGMTRYDVTNPRQPVAIAPALEKGYILSAVHVASGLIATACPRGTTLPASQAVRLLQNTADGVVEKWTTPAVGQSDHTLSLDFDARAERLVRVTTHRQLEILDVRTGERLAVFDHAAERAVFAGRDRDIIAISGEVTEENKLKGSVFLIAAADGRVRASFDYPYQFSALAVSPDRSLVAVGGDDFGVLILDAETLAVRHRFRAHDAGISALCFHPSRPILASGSQDHSIKIWDYATAGLRQTFLGIHGYPKSISFSPNGRLLAVDGRESAIRVIAVDDDAR